MSVRQSVVPFSFCEEDTNHFTVELPRSNHAILTQTFTARKPLAIDQRIHSRIARLMRQSN